MLARWTDAASVGTLALALAITTPVITFFNMQLRIVVATDVNRKYTLANYILTRVSTTLVAAAGIMVCVLPFQHSRPTLLVVLLITFSKASEAISDIIYGYWQLIEHMEMVGKSLLFRGGITLVAFTGSVATTRSVVWGAASLFAGSIGVLLIYDLKNLRSAVPAFSVSVSRLLEEMDFCHIFGRIAPLIRLSAPLGLVAMLISLNSAIPRYFIEAYWGKTQLGIFSALSYFIIAGNLIINAIGQSAAPRLAGLYLYPRRNEFFKMLAALFAISGGLGVVSMAIAGVFGREVLSIYGREYSQSYQIFLIIMAVAAIGYFVAVFNYTLNAIGEYRIQVPLFVAVTTLLVILCRIVIPRYGIAGAAISLLVAGFVQAVASLTVLMYSVRQEKGKLS